MNLVGFLDYLENFGDGQKTTNSELMQDHGGIVLFPPTLHACSKSLGYAR
jgi:hypothetical protein